jgi:hypothetical protein
MRRWIWLLLVSAPFCPARGETEFTSTQTWIHLDGYTHHFCAPGANPYLFGFGVTRYTRTYGPVLHSWEADVFRDSACKPSAYAGYAWTVPTSYFSFGGTAAVMYHRNFKSQDRFRILPVFLPFAETRGERLKFRLYYLPPVRRASDEQIAVQLMLPWAGERYAHRVP